ncbi:helix-turn-helix transcriptional regulator [Paenibacillus glycanilyticus]|uniref:Transcriptional regulator n=1 Tax=Paenibacillus glycanilyticus TaxID=126569 RepID=A0ABQ6GC51_9BACL|nr:YafY family protein [Paenibacillus glycanilyticus]GLX67232.1 transcriptional regulator [Paenibacillus glycanilyticus]
MNKTDRHLAILLELQRSKVVKAEDLASLFETSVRTIYRDIQALSEMGIPVFGAPGQGYSLMEGYFLPPIGFSAEEAVALLMGADFIEQRLDGDYASVAKAVKSKIEAVLPETVREESIRVRETMRLLSAGEPRTGLHEKERLRLVRRAILERRKISFSYKKKTPEADGNRESVREVEPYGLAFVQGNWTLIGHCGLRQDIRHFRLSRMAELVALDTPFAMPDGFNLNHYRPQDDRNEHIWLRANPEIADKIAESGQFYIESAEEREDGLWVQLRVRTPEEVLSLILSWGGDVEVMEPESLRSRVREEAEKMFKRY